MHENDNDDDDDAGHRARGRVGWRHVAAGALAALAVTLLFHRQIVFAPLHHVLVTPDIERYFLPIHEYIKSELLAGRVPLWNPYIYAGTPLAANPQVTLFYPPAWINLLMPVVAGHRLLIALHALLALSFQYLLLRRWGAARAAAALGALPWAFGGYMMANAAVGHLTMLFTAAWLPLVIYCGDRATAERRGRWLVLAGLVLAAQVLAGEPQNSYYTVLGITTFMFARGFERERAMKSLGVAFARLSLIAVVAGSAAAVQLLPTAELARHSDRAENTDEYATAMSMPPRSLIGFLMPWRPDVRELLVRAPFWRRAARINLYWELSCYCGVLTLVLAGVGVAAARGPAPRAAKIVLLVGTILALGASTPLYYLLLDFLPGLRLFRVPARALVIVTWGVSVMAGLGAHWILRDGAAAWRELRWRRIVAACLGATILFLVLLSRAELSYLTYSESVHQLLTTPTRSPVLAPILTLLACLALVIGMRWLPRASLVAAAMLALMTTDLLLAAPPFPIEPAAVQYKADVAMFRNYVTSSRGVAPVRVDFPSKVSANAAMTARVENVNGYWPLSIHRFYHFVHAMRNGRPRSGDRHELAPSLYLAGAAGGAATDPFPLRVLNVRWSSVLLRTRRNPQMSGREYIGPLVGRAWIVDHAEVLPDDAAVLRRMKDPAFDPAKTVLFEAPPPPEAQPHQAGDAPTPAATPAPRPAATTSAAALGAAAAATAAATASRSRCDARIEPGGTLVVRTQSDRDAWLVLSQIHYPGWRATIDGRDVPIRRADYLISAVRLPAGEHRVRYAYRPASVRWGAAITLLTCITIALSGGALALRHVARTGGGMPGG